MTEISDWSAGKPCQLHDMGYCADCKDLAGMRRLEDGSAAYKSDCTIQTFIEITGASYDEAAAALQAAGFRPGAGTPAGGVGRALAAAGFGVCRIRIDLDTAQALSARGRVFFVAGYKGKRGHAWTLLDGKANRAYRPPFRYQVFEVTA